MIADRLLLCQTRRGDRNQGKRRTRSDSPNSLSISAGGLLLSLGPFSHDAQVNITVRLRFSAGMRPKKINRVNGSEPIESLKTTRQRVTMRSE